MGNGKGRGNGGGCGTTGADRFWAVGKVGRVETLIGTLGVRFVFCTVEEEMRGAKVGLLLPIVDGIDVLFL